MRPGRSHSEVKLDKDACVTDDIPILCEDKGEYKLNLGCVVTIEIIKIYIVFSHVFENYNSFEGHLLQLPIHSCPCMISFGKTGI